MMMDYGLLGEHGGSFSCRWIFGRVWNGVGWFRSEEEQNWVSVFERSFEHSNSRNHGWMAGTECSNVPFEHSNVVVGGCLAWMLQTFERSSLWIPRVLGARHQTFERPSQTFKRSMLLACGPGAREFELSLQEFEHSAFDWCWVGFQGHNFWIAHRILATHISLESSLNVESNGTCFATIIDRENEVMMEINNSDHVLLETRLLT